MKTKTVRTLGVAALLAGATFAAYAAMPRARAFDPPTAAQLGLSGAAASQWSALRDRTIDLRDTARGTAQQQAMTLRALLATDAPDLDAFDRDLEQQIDGRIAASRALRHSKLAFYDSLAPDQQAKLRAAMLDRLSRIEHFRSALFDLDAAP